MDIYFLMPLVSVHCMVMNAFKGALNFKPFLPGH